MHRPKCLRRLRWALSFPDVNQQRQFIGKHFICRQHDGLGTAGKKSCRQETHKVGVKSRPTGGRLLGLLLVVELGDLEGVHEVRFRRLRVPRILQQHCDWQMNRPASDDVYKRLHRGCRGKTHCGDGFMKFDSGASASTASCSK